MAIAQRTVMHHTDFILSNISRPLRWRASRHEGGSAMIKYVIRLALPVLSRVIRTCPEWPKRLAATTSLVISAKRQSLASSQEVVVTNF